MDSIRNSFIFALSYLLASSVVSKCLCLCIRGRWAEFFSGSDCPKPAPILLCQGGIRRSWKRGTWMLTLKSLFICFAVVAWLRLLHWSEWKSVNALFHTRSWPYPSFIFLPTNIKSRKRKGPMILEKERWSLLRSSARDTVFRVYAVTSQGNWYPLPTQRSNNLLRFIIFCFWFCNDHHPHVNSKPCANPFPYFRETL